MCTLYYSANSHRKVVHHCFCSHFRRVPKESRRSFESLEEAQAHGYRLCNCCPPVAQKYRKERKEIQKYSAAHALTCKLQDGVFHVISKHDCWRIIVNGKNNVLFLYHKNSEKRGGKKQQSSIVPGFHSQAYHAKTILGYLEYIVSHDEYRDQHPFTPYSTSAKHAETPTIPEWISRQYGNDRFFAPSAPYQRIKGTKKYKKKMAQKKRRDRHAAVIRVNNLLDELAVIGY